MINITTKHIVRNGTTRSTKTINASEFSRFDALQNLANHLTEQAGNVKVTKCESSLVCLTFQDLNGTTTSIRFSGLPEEMTEVSKTASHVKEVLRTAESTDDVYRAVWEGIIASSGVTDADELDAIEDFDELTTLINALRERAETGKKIQYLFVDEDCDDEEDDFVKEWGWSFGKELQEEFDHYPDNDDI